MYGDLALQLVNSSHRTTLSSTPQLPLPKYALPLILSICLETRQLGTSIASIAESHGQLSLTQDRGLVCNLTVQHLAARRNKRCMLAYLATRVGGIKERWWDAGGGLAYLLSPAASANVNPEADAPDLRSALSPQELDFLRGYNSLMLDYKSDFLDVLDLTAGIEKPPGELMVDVRVVRDAGEVFLDSGERVDFRKGQRFRLERAQVERLIIQGYLEEV
ncbi:DNA replication complex GINS protein PSF1 [Cryptococcus neoformans C23]|uniref:DNA replication complex GINS protein PSF1 n=2 Tax=Cryptococcus neoformans TaxID=5207 RepID=A0A854Q9D2_CRYNE|nr:DNA replication complex GINS protein PSF1 [Cryptococcus neoformans var. grubii H99]AUB26534.1 DNA replication complex GINS protein PSF1 [Cryptococcus neoformans var. grubii]OWZ29688.1 DNA replication complex GINS protein PSF1 [Cryptococcus neoformans var. grubii AD2-60a]OWZ37638.1 DNA replication complex GINS protein PSF1 [Cryptococcus neoformans var. grubii AD1-83a]OWZ41560.1 DNA replication complex GINS protein PSF1 [Cryptococcus neoformans var. grubii C23]OWZ52566.1 DNA replication compl|eukprot:XP_012051216.1 DNA replication complex GINS protein PSF1 [Cryptococcus neoformans var. grubii H99]